MEPAWTDQARRVMEYAGQESARLQHPHIDTEHLLLGIIEEGAGPAVTLMMGMGINLQILRESTEDYIADIGKGEATGERTFTPAARRAVERAVEEARLMRKDHVGAEHLLIALQRDKNSAAAHILAAFGLDFRPNPIKPWREGLRGLDDADLDRLRDSAQGFVALADSHPFCAGGFTDIRILLRLAELEARRRAG